MAVCTLSFTSTSEGSLLLLLRAAGIGALLLRIVRIRAFALDSGVPLYLSLLFLLRLLLSRSFAFVVCSPFTGLLVRGESPKASSPDITYRSHDVRKGKGRNSFFPEICFKEALINRLLTRVSGQRKVGEKDESGHRAADHASGDSLVVMHEGSELGIGIGEIDLLIFDEAEMLHDLEMGVFGVLVFEPVPCGLGSFVLDLIPDSDI